MMRTHSKHAGRWLPSLGAIALIAWTALGLQSRAAHPTTVPGHSILDAHPATPALRGPVADMQHAAGERDDGSPSLRSPVAEHSGMTPDHDDSARIGSIQPARPAQAATPPGLSTATPPGGDSQQDSPEDEGAREVDPALFDEADDDSDAVDTLHPTDTERWPRANADAL